MRRTLVRAWLGAVVLTACGCATGPILDNPAVFRTDAAVPVENPVYIPLGPPAYNTVFEKTLDVLTQYFEIEFENRYGGFIRTYPKVAPGLERYLLPGSPSCEERLYATLQSIRYFAVVKIQVAKDGGFWVDVKVFKELEDVPRPERSTAGTAIFRSDNTVERQFEVIEPYSGESSWIPIGRDKALEQSILEQIKSCL
jgi:hypothetical protein